MKRTTNVVVDVHANPRTHADMRREPIYKTHTHTNTIRKRIK